MSFLKHYSADYFKTVIKTLRQVFTNQIVVFTRYKSQHND